MASKADRASTRTPVCYYGGKQRISSAIVCQIMKIPHITYVEPFAGGLAVLYAKGRKPVKNSTHYIEAINDKNKQLITFWRVAREHPEELIQWLSLTPYSQEEYRTALEIYQNPEKYSDLKIAWAVYLVCNVSFACMIGGGWKTSTIRNEASVCVNKLFRLPECFERLREVHIGCEDALDFIKRWDAPHTLIYADPPYINTNQGHYGGYSLEEYQRLCDALDSCQSSYILSGYHQEIAPKSAQECIEIKTKTSAPNGKYRRLHNTHRVEKLWICDRSSHIREDLKSIAMLHTLETNCLLDSPSKP